MKADTSYASLSAPPSTTDALVQEVPLAIAVNDISLVVMMVSPDDIEDFISGYFITEQIIAHVREIKDIVLHHGETGITANVTLTGRREHLLKSRRFTRINGGCGICNHTALEHAFPVINSVVIAPMPVIPFANLRQRMEAIQTRGRLSGALHAAMYCDGENVIIGREDIGRHNALDKVIGAVHRAKVTSETGYLTVTSRCGVELVQKAVIAGFCTLVSFSSPSTLAVTLARKHSLNLVFLPRNNQPVIFHEVIHDN